MTTDRSRQESIAAEAYPATTRLDSLDMLRGLCALAVAIYHFNLWGGLALPSALGGILAVFGTYGVSVFFVLSGFSLAHAYGHKFGDGITHAVLAQYIRRRAGRLIPLYAIVVFASITGKVISGGNIPDFLTIIANILLLFGFVDPTKTPVIGGWSIGLEVVFYVLFPLIVVLRRHRGAMIALSVLLAVWMNDALSAIGNLEQGWSTYVQPANHLLFFVFGVLAGLSGRRVHRGHPLVPYVAIAAILVAALVASHGLDAFAVVTGGYKLIFIPLLLLLVLATSRIVMTSRMRLWASILGGELSLIPIPWPSFWHHAHYRLNCRSISSCSVPF